MASACCIQIFLLLCMYIYIQYTFYQCVRTHNLWATGTPSFWILCCCGRQIRFSIRSNRSTPDTFPSTITKATVIVLYSNVTPPKNLHKQEFTLLFCHFQFKLFSCFDCDHRASQKSNHSDSYQKYLHIYWKYVKQSKDKVDWRSHPASRGEKHIKKNAATWRFVSSSLFPDDRR